eukprot:2027580-Ditylum_brightwellii.AAC.1
MKSSIKTGGDNNSSKQQHGNSSKSKDKEENGNEKQKGIPKWQIKYHATRLNKMARRWYGARSTKRKASMMECIIQNHTITQCRRNDSKRTKKQGKQSKKSKKRMRILQI